MKNAGQRLNKEELRLMLFGILLIWEDVLVCASTVSGDLSKINGSKCFKQMIKLDWPNMAMWP